MKAGAPRFRETLGVATHVPHWPTPDGPVAYEPYVRELEVWARLFAAVEVCAPRGEGAPGGHEATYRLPNVRWRPVDYDLAVRPGARARRLFQAPAVARALGRLVEETDLLLLRSPGHVALIGRIVAGLSGASTITKWAGLFGRYPGERLPSRLERRLILWGGGPTLVYGPSRRPHLIPFIPALMDRAELARAARVSAGRVWRPPWRILSVGRLMGVKGFDLAIRGLGLLHRQRPDLPWEYTLIGAGPEADALRELSRECGIGGRVRLPGGMSFSEVQHHYGRAHVVIMPGVKEGWPKVVAEAWAHGAVPMAASAGILPWILEGEEEGVLFEPAPEALADVAARLLGDTLRMRRMSERGRLKSDQLSLEAFGTRLERVLTAHCGLA